MRAYCATDEDLAVMKHADNRTNRKKLLYSKPACDLPVKTSWNLYQT